MNRIVFEHVGKTFPGAEHPALVPVSLSIEAGGFVTVLGTSGSGKTTLLRLINRLCKPDTGRILVNGEDISTVSETALRRKIGYVIQHIGLFQHLTIARNIAIVPEILKWPKTRITERVDELLNLVGLEPSQFRDRYPRQLSGGQQQRVGLARALAGDPGILLMDEPFGALDALIREKLQDELLGIQSRLKKTIVFVTHDVQEALKLGDQVIIMHGGQVQQYDTPANILANPANEFVSRLLGADDPYRHFSLTQAKTIISNLPDETAEQTPIIRETQDLNDALKNLLQAPEDYVLVENDQQELVGSITLDSLKKQAHLRTPEATLEVQEMGPETEAC